MMVDKKVEAAKVAALWEQIGYRTLVPGEIGKDKTDGRQSSKAEGMFDSVRLWEYKCNASS